MKNLGIIYDRLKTVDKQVIMSSLSWWDGGEPGAGNENLRIIHRNKEYNKLIFIDLEILLVFLKREKVWANESNDVDGFLGNSEYFISRNHPHVIRRLIRMVKQELKKN